ncbi:MAG: very short patch repair endonuclease [Gammaproteobacteria bacterium]|nr:very short patch repair endonuclease [Gammaproteobacteria bacterium]
MADVLTPEQRSRCMSRVKGKNTRPELQLRKALWQAGLRYRLHYAKLPGKPDLVFIKARVAVFVDGCFWHGCPLHASFPAANREYWKKKLDGNIERDRRVNVELEQKGWTVLRFWEHQLKKEAQGVVDCVRSFVKPAASAVYYGSQTSERFAASTPVADENAEYKVNPRKQKNKK